MELATLSVDEVLRIHEILVADFAASGDPISPPGVRSQALLESAVGRQFTGTRDVLKYPKAIDNAATLLFGLVNDHPFHNGNKRTGLVALLVHLDKNKLALFDTRQDELYSMVLRVADHSIAQRPDPRQRRRDEARISADREFAAIRDWIDKRVDRVVRGEREITFRDLRRILESFGYSLQSPKGNSIDVVRFEESTKGLLRKRTVREVKHIGSVGYPGDNTVVSIKDIKSVRRTCRLTAEDGVDSDAFYDDLAVVDSFVNKYRGILRRLARR